MMKTNISFLVSLLGKAGNEYHNKGAYLKIDDKTLESITQIVSIPLHLSTLRVMTDPFYDFLEDQLRKIDPSNDFLKKVGAAVVKQKAKLPIQMSGLEKMTMGDSSVASFSDAVPGPYVISDKLDGVSIQVEYQTDSIKAYTRGDGIFGEDISYLVPYLKLPKTSPYKNIRGEIIMRKKVFDDKWSSQYENPRNLVAGKVNAKTIHPAIRDMDVVIYGVLSDNTENPSVQLACLRKAGFNVVEHAVVTKVNEDQLSTDLKTRKANSPYELDGIVVVADRVGLKHTVDSPQWGRKFKENVDMFEVVVTGISYKPSKDGYLKPRLTITPTRMGGVTVTAANGFNHKFIVESELGIGARILITRSGDVIPHIVEVISGTEKVFEPAETWVWNETGVDAVVADPDNHPEVKLRRISFFFHTLKIDELGESSFEKVVAAGFDTIDKIIKMSQADWKTIDGFAGKRGDIAFTEMRKCLSKVYLPSLADASGFFGRGFGTTRFENILAEIPDMMTIHKSSAEWYTIALTVKGIGETTAKQFAFGIVKFVNWLESMKDFITLVEPEKTEILGKTFSGMGISFTGFRNADWQKIVEQQGGEIVDFGSKTTLLVYGGKKSNKVDAAIKKNIKVMQQGEFLQLLTDAKLI